MRTALVNALYSLLLLGAPHANGQGTILFRNSDKNAPVMLPDGTLVPNGPAFTADLSLLSPGGPQLIWTTPYFWRPGEIAPEVVAVPGINTGQSAMVQARVWETAAGSYENAVALGMLHGEFQSLNGGPDILVSNLGAPLNFPNGNLLAPDLTDFIRPLTLVPEPSSLALAGCGAVVFAWGVKRSVSRPRTAMPLKS